MILKIMGLFDFVTALMFVLLHYGLLSSGTGMFGVAWLFFKAVICRGDVASFIDAAAGIYLLLIMAGFHTFLTYVFALYLLQKVVFSFF